MRGRKRKQRYLIFDEFEHQEIYALSKPANGDEILHWKPNEKSSV